MDQSFGFQTAFSQASEAIRSVTVEASPPLAGSGWSSSWAATPASSPATPRSCAPTPTPS
ncbi:hypothetical protein [Pseudonocardia sp. ICBG601]|uniref:hypothetical protein n=1 Tax=Pseudonocardia sp. ICBG601 TaxID=2846759 RepID=UPI0035AB783B